MTKIINGICFYGVHDYYNNLIQILKNPKISTEWERLELAKEEFEKMLSVAPDISKPGFQDEKEDLKDAYYEFKQIYELAKKRYNLELSTIIETEKLLDHYRRTVKGCNLENDPIIFDNSSLISIIRTIYGLIINSCLKKSSDLDKFLEVNYYLKLLREKTDVLKDLNKIPKDIVISIQLIWDLLFKRIKYKSNISNVDLASFYELKFFDWLQDKEITDEEIQEGAFLAKSNKKNREECLLLIEKYSGEYSLEKIYNNIMECFLENSSPKAKLRQINSLFLVMLQSMPKTNDDYFNEKWMPYFNSVHYIILYLYAIIKREENISIDISKEISNEELLEMIKDDELENKHTIEYLYNILLKISKEKAGSLIDRIDRANEVFSGVLDIIDFMDQEEYLKHSETIKQIYLIMCSFRNQSLSLSERSSKNRKVKSHLLDLELKYLEIIKKYKKINFPGDPYIPKFTNSNL